MSIFGCDTVSDNVTMRGSLLNDRWHKEPQAIEQFVFKEHTVLKNVVRRTIFTIGVQMLIPHNYVRFSQTTKSW